MVSRSIWGREIAGSNPAIQIGLTGVLDHYKDEDWLSVAYYRPSYDGSTNDNKRLIVMATMDGLYNGRRKNRVRGDVLLTTRSFTLIGVFIHRKNGDIFFGL